MATPKNKLNLNGPPRSTRPFDFQIHTFKMKTEVTCNHTLFSSFPDFSGIFNASNTTDSFIGEEKCKWTNAEIARLIQIIIRPILIIVGTVGNCLTFYIMRRTSLKDVSSCFYMSILAVADTGKSLSFLDKNWQKNFYILAHVYVYMCAKTVSF